MSGDLAKRDVETWNGQFKRIRCEIRQGKKQLGRNFLNLLISKRIYSLQGYRDGERTKVKALARERRINPLSIGIRLPDSFKAVVFLDCNGKKVVLLWEERRRGDDSFGEHKGSMNLTGKKMWEPGQNLSRQTPSRSGKFEPLPASAESSWWLQRERKWLVYAKCLKPRHQPCAICERYQPCVLREMAALWPRTEGYLEKVLLWSYLLHWKTQGKGVPSAARICSGPPRATPAMSSSVKQG